MAALRVRSCLIDGEAVCCEMDGVPSFELLRDRKQDGAPFLYAFDLLELDGRSGRTLDWIKVKNPQSPAAKRDAEGFD
jgi:ATP-dependent DNA ligase